MTDFVNIPAQGKENLNILEYWQDKKCLIWHASWFYVECNDVMNHNLKEYKFTITLEIIPYESYYLLITHRGFLSTDTC